MTYRATDKDLSLYLRNVSAKRRAKTLPAGNISLEELLTKGKEGTSAAKTQSDIIWFIENNNGIAWRQNSMSKKGYVKAVSGSGEGISDVVGLIPFYHEVAKMGICVPVYTEAKTTDRLRPNQKIFLTNVFEVWGISMACRSYDEFVNKFQRRFRDLFGIEAPFLF